MNDPYNRDTPGMSDPASNIFKITPNDATDLTVGVKALRIYNPVAAAATISVVTAAGETITLDIPASCLWTEPLRVKRVRTTGTTATLVIHGYTDRAVS